MLAVAGPIFAAALVIVLSIALDQLLLGLSLVKQLQMPTLTTRATVGWLAFGWVITAVVGLLASYFVNINRFSLHALYRNRLIRGYLGASRQARDPDRFTGFDSKDNISVHELWPPKSQRGAGAHCLFHVVNIALNVVSTKRLAWQERKAESFTVTPRHCGSAYLGFRPSDEYGEPKGNGGISLGTAVAISGAAASPNMGYHSSPSMTLLLALFNVRLGWWLGNPGRARRRIVPIGRPEMRQPSRCSAKRSARPRTKAATSICPTAAISRISASTRWCGDAAASSSSSMPVATRASPSKISATRCEKSISISAFGSRFDGLEALRNHPTISTATPRRFRILRSAPSTTKTLTAARPRDNGHILYIKPAYHGTEGAGIRSYATANQNFPHEPTADQWFTESQFESYRSLGLDVANDILGRDIVLCAEPRLSLRDALRALKVQGRRDRRPKIAPPTVAFDDRACPERRRASIGIRRRYRRRRS